MSAVSQHKRAHSRDTGLRIACHISQATAAQLCSLSLLRRHHICAAGPDVGPLPTAPGQGSSSVGSPTTRSSGAAAFGRELPDAPPYKVYMGNVSYDLTDAAVRDLFRDSRVSGMPIQWEAVGRDQGVLKLHCGQAAN